MRVEKRTEDEDGENELPPDNFTGVWEIYWRSGGLKFRGGYKGGQEEGEHFCWWENGGLAQRGLMVCGKCHGVWTDYHEDGHKTLEGTFGPEGKESLWCTFWSNGQAMFEEEWQAGKKHGAHRAFDSEGRLLYEGYYRNDEPFSGICEVMTWEAEDDYHYLAEFQNGCEIRRVPKNC